MDEVVKNRRKEASPMTFAQFCDATENTEQEEQFFQMFQEEKMEPFVNTMQKMQRVPVAGKKFEALYALSQCNSLAAFRQTEHYQYIADSEFKCNFDACGLHLGMSETEKKQAAKFFAVAGAVVAASLLCRKLLFRKAK